MLFTGEGGEELVKFLAPAGQRAKVLHGARPKRFDQSQVTILSNSIGLRYGRHSVTLVIGYQTKIVRLETGTLLRGTRP